MPAPVMVHFRAGTAGRWRIERIDRVAGETLAVADCLDVVEGEPPGGPPPVWTLTGCTSNERYVERRERTALVAVQEPPGRPAATCAALIPVRKSAAWWELPQDERRSILEEQSRHIAVGLEYLPAVSRRLHHARDLGGPFDFLTWFEFAPSDAGRFDELVARLRGTPEWAYVDREVDVRLAR